MHTALTTTSRPSLLREAGLAYFPVALMARLPFAMMVVGILTLVVSARGSLALGGLTSAMTGLGTALRASRRCALKQPRHTARRAPHGWGALLASMT